MEFPSNSFNKFKNIHKGKRGFILGCGPSLADTDLSKIKNEIVFGTSLAYKSGAKINYSFMGDYKIASQFWKDMFYSPFILFVSKRIIVDYFLDRPNTFYFQGAPKGFYKDLSDGKLYGGGTSTYLAMQFAYWMGIEKLYCLGLDHYDTYDYKEMDILETRKKNLSGKPLVISQGPDKHHFTKDFYSEGTEFYLPTVDKMEESYLMAKKAYEEDGRKIYNASLKTALSEEILPRVNFKRVINEENRA